MMYDAELPPEGSEHRVLCVGAHPDDVEMGMGGTVAALVAKGHAVTIVDLTRGQLGTYGDPQTRAAEARVAAQRLGVELRILDHEDGAVTDDLEGRHEMVRLLREIRPSLVFAPYPHARTGALDGRANVDHLATGLLVREGTKLARFRRLMPELPPCSVRRLLYYMVPDDQRPSFVVDVSAHEETLRSAISAYASQLEISRSQRPILDVLMAWRQSHGLRIGARLGEAFLCEDTLGGDVEHLLSI